MLKRSDQEEIQAFAEGYQLGRGYWWDEYWEFGSLSAEARGENIAEDILTLN